MIKEITQAVEDLVSQIDNSIVGSYDSINGYTLVCKSKYARVGKFATDINLDTFLITAVDPDTSITAGTLDGLFYLPQPYFVNGTRISVNREWTIANPDLMQKTPLIWLLDDIRYSVYGRESVNDWESEIRMFFVDETDATNFYNKDHIENVVLPMTNLAQLFVETINSNRKYRTIERYAIRNFTRFGTENSQGYVQNILDANMSGVELTITLIKYKENCKC